MIGMIRINLLPAKDGRRRRAGGGGQKTGAILMLFVVLELLAMYAWYQDVSDHAAEQQSIAKRAEDKVAALETEIYEIAGEQFNIGSPQQLGAIMFEKLDFLQESPNFLPNRGVQLQMSNYTLPVRLTTVRQLCF